MSEWEIDIENKEEAEHWFEYMNTYYDANFESKRTDTFGTRNDPDYIYLILPHCGYTLAERIKTDYWKKCKTLSKMQQKYRKIW